MESESEDDLSQYVYIHNNENLKIRLVQSEQWDPVKEPPNNLNSPITILKREEWGAVPPVSKEHNCNPQELVLLLDTRGESCDSQESCKARVKELQRYYMEEKGLPDIPWNFLVAPDGVVYEGRGWTSKSSKLTELHKGLDSMDIAYIGNYQEEIPNRTMTQTVERLINIGIKKYCIQFGHNTRSDLMNNYVDNTPDPPIRHFVK